jgi:hypothetical protein
MRIICVSLIGEFSVDLKNESSNINLTCFNVAEEI